MLFNSQTFLLLFLPLTLLLYYRVQSGRGIRAWALVGASLIFYGYWDMRFLPLLVFSIAANWLLAWAYVRKPHRFIIPAGVALNLAILGVFKYANFFADTLGALLGTTYPGFDIILPLGISFFTFQQISYLVDLKRGRAPLYPFRDYALYVSFFPQLIAGPIVRHHEIIPQYELSPVRPGLDERLARGFVLLLIGLAKKVLLADKLAGIVDPLFASAAAGGYPDPLAAWTATAAFGLQIYFDFSAYSDMAIGLGLMFGFSLPFNFDAPYRAASIRDFWHRWHMTLSRFLRDYLYIPLGGNRHGPGRQIGAIMITMLLGGLWHGAAWTFVVWGGVHGVALVVNHVWRTSGRRLPWPVGRVLTLVLVLVAFVVFRAEDFATAERMLGPLVGPLLGLGEGGFQLTGDVGWQWAIVALAGAITQFVPTSQQLALEKLTAVRPVAKGIALGLALLVLVILVGGPEPEEFIYFQF